jgi:hypothetical protein
MIASLFRTVAIIAAVWFILICLFTAAWCALMNAVHEAERQLRDDEETPDGIVELDLRKSPEKMRKPAA